MNTARVVLRLSRRNLAHRPGTAALLLVAVSTATLTLAVSLTIGSGAGSHWDDLYVRTGGAQVVATADRLDTLTPLLAARGVAASIGPFRLVEAAAEVNGRPVRLRLIGRDTLRTPIDHPLLTSGSGDLSGSGIVLDHNVATATGARPGDVVRIGGQTLIVRGSAVSTAQPPFPYHGPGLAWVSRASADRLGASAAGQPGFRRGYQVELRLSGADDTAGFVAAQHLDPAVQVDTGPDIRDSTTVYLRVVSDFLLTVGGLLGVLAGCGITVLVSTRTHARLRQVGTLKAIGATPGQVVAATLAEYLAVALLAAGAGLAIGLPVATALGRRASTALGIPDGSRLSLPAALAVATVAITAVLLAGIRPAWRATRNSTVHDLGALVRPPRRASGLTRLATAIRLPLPAVLGLRSFTRRPARTLLTICSLGLAVAMGTTALILEAVSRQFVVGTASGAPADGYVDQANRALLQELQDVVRLLAVLFIVLGVVNLLLVSTAAARDAAANQAALQAVGFTPGQTVASLATTQTVTAALATVVGIPVGTLLFRAFASGNGTLNPGTPTSLTPVTAILLATGTIALSALLAAIPAGALARGPVTNLLTTD